MGLLEGKTAIVTGAGRGIGRAHALLLAEQGASVVVNDVDATEAKNVVGEIESAGGSAAANTDDVTTYAGASALVDQAVEAFDRLDILVNNAGIIRDAMSFSMSEEDWDDVVRVHLKGHFAPSHFAGIHWRERSKNGQDVSGRIINTVSESGLYGLAGQINYATAKAGIASMTIVLARELKKYGITVNAICPRARTRMTETVLQGMGPNEAGFDEWEPANISPTVVWLASDLAGDVTGQVFIIFGGRIHLMHGWSMDGEIERPDRWTPEEIAEHSPTLFGNHSSRLPAMGFGR